MVEKTDTESEEREAVIRAARAEYEGVIYAAREAYRDIATAAWGQYLDAIRETFLEDEDIG